MHFGRKKIMPQSANYALNCSTSVTKEGRCGKSDLIVARLLKRKPVLVKTNPR